MPTIGQLPPANSVSDADEMAIFQDGQTLAATRAQVLAGVQSRLSLPQNTLLGGLGPGVTSPVPVTIGANLVVSGTTISAAAAPFEIPALPAGAAPSAGDVAALGQAGRNVGVTYAAFLGAMGGVAGLPGGNFLATATGGTTARSISALTGNAVAIEDFGAKGDGVTDDGPALLAAIASGNPVRLGPKTYAIAGACDISGATCSLLGVPGLTILWRSAQTKIGVSPTTAWISVTATNFVAEGVIFDANLAITQTGFSVLIQPACVKSSISHCVFRYAAGGAEGSGLTYVASDPATTQHDVRDCAFTGNAVHGLYAQAIDGLSVAGCRAHDNGGDGIHVDSLDPSFALKIRNLQITDNSCWNNTCGILVGNFNATNVNVTPFTYGNANPDVLGAVISGNNCDSNRGYGIYISGRNILVAANLCANNSAVTGSGAGILCDTGYCKVTGNMVTGASAFGIDCGGSVYTEVDHNYINGAYIGLNIGGGQHCMARGNFIQDCTGVGIAVQNVESDGGGDNFGLACDGLSIIGNWIGYGGNVTAILIRDAAQNILVQDNVIVGEPGANLGNAISPYSDTVVIRRNLLNYTTSWPVNPGNISGVYSLVIPDIVDRVTISQASLPIARMVTTQANQAVGSVTFAKISSGGSGYTTATINFFGTGTGASARAWISGGVIIGIQMSNFGSGYGTGTQVVISGDGSGAAATAQVGLPVLQGREVSIDCLATTVFAASGAVPAQNNWTNAPISVPAGASIDWIGTGGGWRAARFSQNDYVSPNGDGSVTLRTQSGNISLHPAGSGSVRILSDTEATGAAELIGRGSPLNAVSAPAGSTFRNLNGGVGSTFWVNQAAGAGNWVALA
ncbi:MAG: right-handed parallel beta-helix repeat-containing protein [Acidocella sp.]|nr:right-handed parallel beta-helix repeat-containing protein [Acidocella sp.]